MVTSTWLLILILSNGELVLHDMTSMNSCMTARDHIVAGYTKDKTRGNVVYSECLAR